MLCSLYTNNIILSLALCVMAGGCGVGGDASLCILTSIITRFGLSVLYVQYTV